MNKRSEDPFVKTFMDDNGYELKKEWGLPKPNMEASYKSLAKYAKNEPNFTEKQVAAMNKAIHWMKLQFYPHMRNSRVLSLDEVIDKLDLSTSTGFPFNTVHQVKKDIFDKDPTIREWLEEDFQTNLLLRSWVSVATSSLKEEIRPEEKIQDNNIRTFTAMPLDATCHGNRLFKDMNEKFNAAHFVTASCVGMSPYDGNWEFLYQKLNVFRKGYALDGSQWDSAFKAFALWAIAEFRYECLQPGDQNYENWLRIQNLYSNIINTIIITPEGNLVRKKGGNPSGSVNTINDNTMYLYILMAYAWIMQHEELGIETSYAEFENNTAKALVGDDNTWTVSDTHHDIYNGLTVAKQWATAGMKATSDTWEPREAKYLDFLSAHFLEYKGVMVPHYNNDKLMTSLLYCNRSKASPILTLQRVAGLLNIGWTDPTFRKFCWALSNDLIYKYGRLLTNDAEWVIALSQLQTDEVYEFRFLGGTIKCVEARPQFYSETQERLIKLNKDRQGHFMSTTVTTTRKTLARKPKQAVARKPRVRTITKIVQARPTRRRVRNTRAPRKRMVPRDSRFKSQTGNFNGQFIGGQVVSNVTTKPSDRIESFNERVGTVFGSTGFTILRYPINPGQSLTFPWLNQIAKLYERYEFMELEFYFRHDVSQYAAQGQKGLLYLSTNYDASSPNPSNSTQIVDGEPKVFGMPNQDLCLHLNKKALSEPGPEKFIRPYSLPGNTDIKTYDAGALFVATEGMTDNTEIGKLHVRGKVRFRNRLLEPIGTLAPLNNMFIAHLPVQQVFLDNTTAAFTQWASLGGAATGITIGGSLNAEFRLPIGHYIFFCRFFPTFSSTTDCQIFFFKDGVPNLPPQCPVITTGSGSFGQIFFSAPTQSDGTNIFTFEGNFNSTLGATSVGASVQIMIL
nr:polyprotein 2 [Patatavirales sp.]